MRLAGVFWDLFCPAPAPRSFRPNLQHGTPAKWLTKYGPSGTADPKMISSKSRAKFVTGQSCPNFFRCEACSLLYSSAIYWDSLFCTRSLPLDRCVCTGLSLSFRLSFLMPSLLPLTSGGVEVYTSARYLSFPSSTVLITSRIITDRFALADGANLDACNPGDQDYCGGTWNTCVLSSIRLSRLSLIFPQASEINSTTSRMRVSLQVSLDSQSTWHSLTAL